MSKARDYRIKPRTKVDLSKTPADDDGGLLREHVEAELPGLKARLSELQELLYAEGKHALLVVLQAMDGGGKDSTIRSVFSGVNPQGCQVVNFKAPTAPELSHDFLWRVHPHTPGRGYITVFNRSHYEDVLAARVNGLVEQERWERRYEHINAFEKTLHDEGVTILKFFLHITKEYQRQRLQRRVDRPQKRWKFDPADLAERARWSEYQQAYQDALRRCSTNWAPWYVVPAEKRWYRDLVILRVLIKTLESLDMKFPPLKFDPATIVIE